MVFVETSAFTKRIGGRLNDEELRTEGHQVSDLRHETRWQLSLAHIEEHMAKKDRTAKWKRKMSDFERLLEGVQEMVEAEHTGSARGRSREYVGQVLVRIREGRKTVWTLQGAAEELQAVLEKEKFASLGDAVVVARKVLRQSQEGFAALLGISTATLQGWEQGRRIPHGPAQTLLRVAMKHPQEVLDAVTDESYTVGR